MTALIPGENDLLAYVDGQLDDAGRQRVEQYLLQNPQAAKKVAEWLDVNQRLRIVLTQQDPELDTARYDPRLILHKLQQRRQMRLAMAFMVLISVGGGGAAGWQFKTMQMQSATLPMEDAVHAYNLFTRDRLPMMDVAASNRDDMNNWLSRYFINGDMPPNFEKYGFKLLGGRLMATDQGPSALVVYQNAQGMRITFYIRPTGKTALKSGYRETGNLMAQYWSDHKYNYAIISPANDNQTAGVQKAVADYTANAPTV